jgi:hypothetical protein
VPEISVETAFMEGETAAEMAEALAQRLRDDKLI